MGTSVRRRGSRALPLVLLVVGVGPLDAMKWPFSVTQPPVPQQVKVSFDDESFSFWDPFKHTGFNASSVLVPAVEEAGRRAPGYIAYAGFATALKLFLPPNALTALNVIYVAGALARPHRDVEAFCKNEGTLLLLSPPIHVALMGSVLRATRFRTWRRLFVKATLFRLRYQLLFRRMYRPRWVTTGPSSMTLIVKDTAAAARSVQGLFPGLCSQTALLAGGCRLPYWPDCIPPPRVEKGWRKFRRLDRGLKREFGKRARRVRPGDGRRHGVGILGWRIPHKIVFGTVRMVGGLLSDPASRAKRSTRKRRGGRKGRDRTRSHNSRLVQLEGSDGGQEGEATVELLKEVEDKNEDEEEEPTESQSPRAPILLGHTLNFPVEGPLIRLHNVTAIASVGSTLTKSYRALAELPFGDADEFAAWSSLCSPSTSSSSNGVAVATEISKEAKLPGWTAADPEDIEVDNETDKQHSAVVGPPSMPPPPPPPPASLQPVIIKRNVPRQLKLSADDIAAAQKALRRMTYRSELDLDLSGVMAEVAAAVAKAGDLRVEASSIEMVRANLARAGMLGSAVVVPQVMSCPELGRLARRGLLVTTALRGVDVSDARVMDHAAARGEKERGRFVDGLFAVFGQMCLADGCFPSNPMPDNLLYMYSGQVGLTDLSAVCQLTEEQRRALCRLYRTMAELKNEDATNPSAAAESKARAVMEGVGFVIDLPPAGGIARTSTYYAESRGGASALSPSSLRKKSWTQEEVMDAVAAAGEATLDVSLGNDAEAAGSPDGGEDDEDHDNDDDPENKNETAMAERDNVEMENEQEEKGEDEEDEEVVGAAAAVPPPSPPSPPPPLMVARAPLTHVLLLRGLFDTQRDEALDLLGGGCVELMRGMAVRRLPRAMVPVLRMVANLRGVCAHLDVDKSLLPQFSRAASKGLSWRLALSSSRGGGADRTGAGLGLDSSSQRLASAIYQPEAAEA